MSQSRLAEYHKKYLTNIKNFKVVRQIESGAFGCVYSIQNNLTEKEYAAKVIYLGKNEIKYKQMIDREIGILIRFQHPTIINFYGFSLSDFSDQKNVTLIMELAKKGSLAEILRKARLSRADPNYDNTARQIILVGIACGMMYLHQHRVIHRDLKPDNILLDEFLHPRISDFGLSKLYEAGHSKSQSQQCGTMIYMAPEVVSGEKYNGKADVYSFGILMYEVVTDSIAYPFLENGKMTIFDFNNKVVNENLRPKFTVPVKPGIQKLIELCWSSNPNERPTFEEIFKKLAFNEEENIYDIDYDNKEEQKDDDREKYYLEGVDVDELQFYIDDIYGFSNQDQNYSANIQTEEISKKLEILTEERELIVKQAKENIQSTQKIENEIKSITKNNEKMKNQINIFKNKNLRLFNKYQHILTDIETYENRLSYADWMAVNIFNSFLLNPQQFILSKIINYSPYLNSNYSIVKLNDFLLYVKKFMKKKMNTKLLEIATNDTNELFNSIFTGEAKFNQFAININGINLPKKMLESSEFSSQLRKFNNFNIQLKYPSKSFQKIYSLVSDLQCMPHNKVSLSVFITKISKIDVDLMNKTCIESIIIDSTVETILTSAFQGCSSLKQITIPPSVTTIGFHAFENCSSLEQIILSSSILTLKNHIFHGCKSLKQIKLPPSLTGIAESAFFGCESLVQIKIPDSVEIIGPSAFEACNSLQQISLPTSLKFIGIKAFCQCRSLMNISIPSSIANIPKECFNLCTSLNQVFIPSSVTSISEDAFNLCKSLVSITIPDSVTSIGKGAFSNCSLLTEILFSSRLTAIQPLAFNGCSSLKSVKIPESVRSIQSYAFCGCSSLTSIEIPSKYIVIDINAFSECSSLNDVSVSMYAREISPATFHFANIKKI